MNETTKINHVRFNNHIIKANYYSPYPILKSLKQSDSLLKLYVCKSCFKYFLNRSWFKKHFAKCQVRPPGRLVYNDHEHNLKIYKIDGSLNKLYCQNLSLFGKLFIDNKTVYFEVEGFDYFVLIENDDQPVAYFSREKKNVDHYNLACIITFPPFQGRSFGRFLIEFSYTLSHLEGYYGTPERPLSDLGSKAYLSFWLDTLKRSLPDDSHNINDNNNNCTWTLKQWSECTGLREDDIIFTLKQSNLLNNRVRIHDTVNYNNIDNDKDVNSVNGIDDELKQKSDNDNNDSNNSQQNKNTKYLNNESDTIFILSPSHPLLARIPKPYRIDLKYVMPDDQ